MIGGSSAAVHAAVACFLCAVCAVVPLQDIFTTYYCAFLRHAYWLQVWNVLRSACRLSESAAHSLTASVTR